MIQKLENCTLTSPPQEIPLEQRFAWKGVQWEQFKAIQASFRDIPGIRLSYSQEVLEIVGTGKLHEAIKSLIAALLIAYFEIKDIEFFPSGSFSQIVEGVVEYQADLSYCLGTDKDIPDLSIEVVVTSGSPIKLAKYRLMGVSEVWFWEDGVWEIYYLRAEGYEIINKSELLPELDLELLTRCLLLTSPLEAIKEFRRAVGTRQCRVPTDTPLHFSE
jgi:Uma2 family endonuclease